LTKKELSKEILEHIQYIFFPGFFYSEIKAKQKAKTWTFWLQYN